MLDQRIESAAFWVKERIEKEVFPANILIKKEFQPASKQSLLLAHREEYLDNCDQNPEEEIIKTFELVDKRGNYNRYDPESAQEPLSNLMLKSKKVVGASMFAAEIAFNKGFAFFLGGGLHHAMTFGGRGFCQFNDIVIAARHMQKLKGLKQIWIIDVDAHKGDGTAEILKDDPSIATLSVHMAQGWPLDESSTNEEGKLHPWFIASDVEVPVEEGEEGVYMEKLKKGLDALAERFPSPDFVIVVQGSDPYKKDQLPSSSLLRLELEQMLERDNLVYSFLKKQGVPQLYLMSGGYGEFAHEPYINFLESVKDDIQKLSKN